MTLPTDPPASPGPAESLPDKTAAPKREPEPGVREALGQTRELAAQGVRQAGTGEGSEVPGKDVTPDSLRKGAAGPQPMNEAAARQAVVNAILVDVSKEADRVREALRKEFSDALRKSRG